MNESIRLLQKKFLEIKKLGYVKTIRGGSTGVGATLEKLLDKPEESFEIPDYYGIELKTKRAYSKSSITLFNAVPTGGTYYEVKRLRDTYGWPTKGNKEVKSLYAMVSTKSCEKVGLFHYYKLDVNVSEERIYLEIYDLNWELIDKETYWDFDILKEKLERKLQVLALIKAWTKTVNNEEYFNYYKMNIYVLKSFDSFIKALLEGKIKINLRITTHTDEKRYGNVDSHGVGFEIVEDDLLEIYDLYR
jgi:hypothetical protein